jgi:chromosomal replication initiator protein
MHDRWLACATQLEAEVPAQLYKTWIKPLTYLGYDESEHVLRLGVPNQFKLNWVKTQFGTRIAQLAGDLIAPDATVQFEIAAPGAARPKARAGATTSASAATGEGRATASGQASEAGHASDGTASPRAGRHAAAVRDTASAERDDILADDPPVRGVNGHRGQMSASPQNERTKLRGDLTFDNFVTGKSNQMARAAALQVCDKPGIAYNPLFLYGGVGLGKTHLIHAVGNAILERNPAAKVRYIHAQEYFEEMVRAIQKKTPDDWKQAYQSLDLLLIDDIQFLSGKPRTQEEFFYTFDALFAARKQIIITCDTYPKEIAGVEERLISRFDSGLIVAIEPPELEMRVAILHKKAEMSGADIPDDVAFFIAKHLRSNVRELEGALLRVVAYAGFRNKPVTLELAKEALEDLLALNRRQISIDVIQKTCADFFKLKVADMYSKRRLAHIVLPRQIAMYLAKELTQKSLPEIGDAFGGRDHTTVLHAVRKIAEQRQHDADLNHSLHVLEQTLRG